MSVLASLAVGLASTAFAADGSGPSGGGSRVGRLRSMGDAAMAPVMDAWLATLRARHPGLQPGRWEHSGDERAFGALMFGLADMAPLAREPSPGELAPYAHQFAGDMMKSPLLVRVGSRAGRPAYLAVNRRPGAPLPSAVREYLAFALSNEGQEILAGHPGFAPLSRREAQAEAAKLDGFLPELDAGIPDYRPQGPVRGEIRSVGSDGMRSLMDRWMRDFRALQPGVSKGERWEHLGTLNGFHALLVGEADIAPMGRELWPQERTAYASVHGASPLEIRVARGGFNTPQRTTAQAVFVHADNPLGRITLPQLAAILSTSPTITSWGQLGLSGPWADRPLTLYTPPLTAPNAMSMQIMVLGGGAWNSTARQGSIAETAAAIARDPAAIGFGGFEEGGPGLKALAVAASLGAPFYEGTGETVADGRYPLSRYMYIRLPRKPGGSVSAPVKEFLRYVLSREGQEPIRYSGYFPLTAAEVREELAKLE